MLMRWTWDHCRKDPYKETLLVLNFLNRKPQIKFRREAFRRSKCLEVKGFPEPSVS